MTKNWISLKYERGRTSTRNTFPPRTSAKERMNTNTKKLNGKSVTAWMRRARKMSPRDVYFAHSLSMPFSLCCWGSRAQAIIKPDTYFQPFNHPSAPRALVFLFCFQPAAYPRCAEWWCRYCSSSMHRDIYFLLVEFFYVCVLSLLSYTDQAFLLI